MTWKQTTTPTKAVQSFINAKKSGNEPSEDSLSVIRNYRKWKEPELIGLLNASGYYPEILVEDGMEQSIASLLQKFKDRQVPHKWKF
ncbi:hypothetical protein [Leptospira sp. GIMC2001]|uniref:hypothetical protein n=1 Tax=Leptospira sp. GIMC2001 TaxID=1513297 RepID=UPI002349D673|nr:hypothetical protein [Leptospira sp. GIMC2001]WCL51286.1 hypothetical protein O4O04_02395 [Leptospira sp. GIMC2001]